MQNMKMRTADYISDFLVRNGITQCFMITGGGAMHLNDALGHNEKIKCMFNHHEQGSAIAAESYARLTGKIAAVCVTSGPGGTNAITGVMGGWLDSIPMMIISGQVKRETTMRSCPDINLRQLGDQEFNITDSVSCMTKYAVMLTDPYETAYHFEKALYLALNGRMGPVWIDIPLDVQSAVIDTDKLSHFNAEAEMIEKTAGITRGTAEEIIGKIKNASAPLLLAGTGIRLAGAEEGFLKLIEKLKIPVVTAWNANDTVAYDNPYYVGFPGTVGTRPGNFAVQNCDLLISIGCRLNIRMIGYNHFNFAENAYKIIVDIDPQELMKPTVKADMPINADAGAFIGALLECGYAPQEKHGKWLEWCRSLTEKYPSVLPEYHKDTAPINPYVFMEILFEKLKENDRIICGNGSASVITYQCAKIRQGQRMYANSGCAAMGYALPAALGAAAADNSARTICVDGDGSIMMNIQELAAVAYNKLNIKIILLNNGGYHSIRQTQRNLFKSPFVGIDGESGVGFPDFSKIAEAFGIQYFSVDREDSAKAVLDEALSGENPCICEVFADSTQDFAPKSASRVMPDGRMVSPSIDDMAPFLDREEYESIKYRGV